MRVRVSRLTPERLPKREKTQLGGAGGGSPPSPLLVSPGCETAGVVDSVAVRVLAAASFLGVAVVDVSFLGACMRRRGGSCFS